jgi:outer membrane protein TolC
MKNRITIIIIYALLITFSGNLSAQEHPLTLDEALKTVLLNNNSYRISVEKVKESGFQVREAWGQLWPSLSTDVSYTRQWAESGMGANTEGQYNISLVKGQIAVNPGGIYNC